MSMGAVAIASYLQLALVLRVFVNNSFTHTVNSNNLVNLSKWIISK